MAALERSRALSRRWRCFWSWPPGHAYELIDYVDPLSGRWAARARCVVCAHQTGLAIGDRKSGVHFANNPLATMLASQGTLRTVPASTKIGTGPPDPRASGFVVSSPHGDEVAVRYVQVRFDVGLRRNVYCAWRLGEENSAVIARDLGVAVARAAGASPSDEWIERLTRQLAGELPSRS
jgi:hypothetical protein